MPLALKFGNRGIGESMKTFLVRTIGVTTLAGIVLVAILVLLQSPMFAGVQ